MRNLGAQRCTTVRAIAGVSRIYESVAILAFHFRSFLFYCCLFLYGGIGLLKLDLIQSPRAPAKVVIIPDVCDEDYQP